MLLNVKRNAHSIFIMSDFFQYVPYERYASKSEHGNKCMFQGLSPCNDHVSRFICNAHASTIFGLIYQYVHTTDGNNEVNYSIVTYTTTSTWNWYLPLFKNHITNVVSCDEIMAYASNVSSSTNGKFDSLKLFDILTHYMSLNAFTEKCSPKTWFDDNPANSIIMYDEIDDNIKFIKSKDIPQLHKYLFAYIGSSLTQTGDVYKIQIDTVALVRSNNSIAFTLINKPRVLKYTTHKNCVATPLVAAALRYVSIQETQLTFNKISSSQIHC